MPGSWLSKPRDAGEPAATESRWESLIELRETERSVKEATKAGPTRRPPWKKWPIALAASLFGLVALGVIIITIRDKNGRETKISVPDDSTIVVEGPRQNVEIKPPVSSREEARGTGAPTPSSREAGKPSVDNAQGPPSDNAVASGFVSLFNGTDFSGWTFPLGSEGDWTVENGSIRGSGTVNTSTLASSRTDYEDFHLRMEVRTSDNWTKNLCIRASHSDGDVKYYVFWTGVRRVGGEIASLGEYRLKRGGHAQDWESSHHRRAPRDHGSEITWSGQEYLATRRDRCNGECHAYAG